MTESVFLQLNFNSHPPITKRGLAVITHVALSFAHRNFLFKSFPFVVQLFARTERNLYFNQAML